MEKRQVKLAILLSLSIVLSFFKFPVFPYAPFLTLDLSLLPIILSCLLFSYRTSLVLLGIRFIILFFFQGFNFPVLVGNFSDTLVGWCLITLQISLILNNKKLKSLLIIVVTTLVMTFLNKWVIFPLYNAILHVNFPKILIWLAIFPFNLLKCSILITLSNLVNKRKLN